MTSEPESKDRDATSPDRSEPTVPDARSTWSAGERAEFDRIMPRCPTCRYRLDRTPEGVACPECGVVSTGEARRAYAIESSVLRRLLLHFSPMLATAALLLLGLLNGPDLVVSDVIIFAMLIALYAFVPWTIIQSSILHYRWMRRRALLQGRDLDGGAFVVMLLVSIVTAAGVAAASVAMLFAGCLAVVRLWGW